MSTNETEQNQIDQHTRNSSSPVWDMSQERVFMETLLNQRVNFFLVLFSITVAGGINADLGWRLCTILLLGTVLSILLMMALNRNQEKLSLIFAELEKDTSHPVTIIDKKAKPNGSRQRMVSIWLPRICVTLLVLATLTSVFSTLRNEQTNIVNSTAQCSDAK